MGASGAYRRRVWGWGPELRTAALKSDRSQCEEESPESLRKGAALLEFWEVRREVGVLWCGTLSLLPPSSVGLRGLEEPEAVTQVRGNGGHTRAVSHS